MRERVSPLGEKVRELRVARGWSQTRLSEESGVDQATISHIEVGRVQRPSDETLRKLAVGFGVRVEFLLAVAGALDAPSPDRAALANVVAWLESRADLVELLEQVRRDHPSEVYREFLDALTSAWEADIRMAVRQFQLGRHCGLQQARSCSKGEASLPTPRPSPRKEDR